MIYVTLKKRLDANPGPILSVADEKLKVLLLFLVFSTMVINVFIFELDAAALKNDTDTDTL